MSWIRCSSSCIDKQQELTAKEAKEAGEETKRNDGNPPFDWLTTLQRFRQIHKISSIHSFLPNLTHIVFVTLSIIFSKDIIFYFVFTLIMKSILVLFFLVGLGMSPVLPCSSSRPRLHIQWIWGCGPQALHILPYWGNLQDLQGYLCLWSPRS